MDRFPNPGNGVFNIAVSNPENNERIEIYNNLGALVYKQTIINELNTIDLSDQANGLYFVKLVRDNQMIVTQKIMKQ